MPIQGLLCYEYFITFEHEIRAVWSRKINMTSILFLSIRWSMVVNLPLLALPSTPQVNLLRTNLLPANKSHELDVRVKPCSGRCVSDLHSPRSCVSVSYIEQVVAMARYTQVARENQ